MTDSRSRLRSATRLALLPALAIGVAALLAGSRTAGAAAPSAFVRVNQVGYPARCDEAGLRHVERRPRRRDVRSRNRAARPCLSAPIGASLGSWSRTYSFVHPLDFDDVTDGGELHGRGDRRRRRRRRRRSRSAPDRPSTDRRSRTRCPSTRRSATARTTSRTRCAPRPRTSTTRTANDVRDAARELGRALLRRPARRSARASTRPAAGGTPATTSRASRRSATRRRCCCTASASFPTSSAPARRRRTSPPRRSSAPTGCCACGTTPTRTFYYQVGIGTGNAKTVGDHDLWRLPQADDTFGGTDPLYRYIRNRPVFRAGAARLADQPEPRRAATPPCSGSASSSSRRAIPAFANRCLLAGAAHLRPRGHEPAAS